IQQSSVGFPFKETREPFGADARVSVTQDRVGAGRLRGQLLYRIRIESPGGTAKVETVFSKQRALATAARVAALLGAEVDETTT
ncbi:MAG: hypothetical protein OER88_06340, partial [Planctomycetota bacterium]|nr:hypothetical protein [Planctomycetota bacterium]